MTTNSLIPVFSGSVSNETTQLVDARTLYSFLEVSRDFSTWIKGCFNDSATTENQDFILTFTKTGERKNVKVNHYHLTLDMAKELSMVERNEKGREARRYFIECERRLHNQPQQHQIMIDQQGPLDKLNLSDNRNLCDARKLIREISKDAPAGSQILISELEAVIVRQYTEVTEALHAIATAQRYMNRMRGPSSEF